MNQPYHYYAQITRCIDGDTFEAVLDLGFSITLNCQIRCIKEGYRFDAPETRRRKGVCAAQQEHGFAAKKRAEEILLNKKCVVRTVKTDSFGRWLGEIWCDGQEFADQMIAEGFQKRDSYLLTSD